jgi:hypothetical protein
MDVVVDLLNGPTKLWHLLIVCAALAFGLKVIRDQLSANFEMTIKIWDAVDPCVVDEAEVTLRRALSSQKVTNKNSSPPRDGQLI